MKKLTSVIISAVLALTLTACDANKGIGSGVTPPPLSDAAVVGDVVRFGEHDWRILASEDGKVLLIAERILEQRAFCSKDGQVLWETSDIREYLNSSFYESFSEGDRTRIVETVLQNEGNPWFQTDGGSKTSDKIFLLSLEEAVLYFGDSGQLANPNIESIGGNSSLIQSAISDQFNAGRVALDLGDNATAGWWLRTPGQYRMQTIDVTGLGTIHVAGVHAAGTHRRRNDAVYSGGIRPAMWVNL
jgi:hypothetical protein